MCLNEPFKNPQMYLIDVFSYFLSYIKLTPTNFLLSNYKYTQHYKVEKYRLHVRVT